MQKLTPRELSVIRLIERGFTYDEMGRELGISPRTVKAVTDRIRLKIGASKKRNIPDIVRRLGIDTSVKYDDNS